MSTLRPMEPAIPTPMKEIRMAKQQKRDEGILVAEIKSDKVVTQDGNHFELRVLKNGTVVAEVK